MTGDAHKQNEIKHTFRGYSRKNQMKRVCNEYKTFQYTIDDRSKVMQKQKCVE